MEYERKSNLIGCTDRGRAGYPSDSSRAGRDGPHNMDTSLQTRSALRLCQHDLSSPPPQCLAARPGVVQAYGTLHHHLAGLVLWTALPDSPRHRPTSCPSGQRYPHLPRITAPYGPRRLDASAPTALAKLTLAGVRIPRPTPAGMRIPRPTPWDARQRTCSTRLRRNCDSDSTLRAASGTPAPRPAQDIGRRAEYEPQPRQRPLPALRPASH